MLSRQAAQRAPFAGARRSALLRLARPAITTQQQRRAAGAMMVARAASSSSGESVQRAALIDQEGSLDSTIIDV